MITDTAKVEELKDELRAANAYIKACQIKVDTLVGVSSSREGKAAAAELEVAVLAGSEILDELEALEQPKAPTLYVSAITAPPTGV